MHKDRRLMIYGFCGLKVLLKVSTISSNERKLIQNSAIISEKRTDLNYTINSSYFPRSEQERKANLFAIGLSKTVSFRI